jgi:hypothetical protein
VDVLQVSHQQSSMGYFHFLGLKTHNFLFLQGSAHVSNGVDCAASSQQQSSGKGPWSPWKWLLILTLQVHVSCHLSSQARQPMILRAILGA